MSKTWVIGAAICAAAGTTALVGTVLNVGTAGAVPPAASATRATATPTAATPTLSLAATRKLATAAANVVSPALVDLLAYTATTPRAGTGIVLTPTGEVLTNDHVIRGATRITATDIGTGRTYTARVVGHDAAADIAVLRLAGATGLPTARLAPTAATVGQSVFAVGNAHGTGGTAWASGSVTDTSRSVNATNEHVRSTEALSGMLQTTTPIVPGYSGGALVNTAGEVLGVNTAGTFSTPGKPATAAFAVPIARAMKIVQTITAD
jgi:S1-C subfamily serine protease